MGIGGGAIILCSLFFLYVAHPVCPCSEMSQLFCNKGQISNAPDSLRCGGHLFRCGNSTMEIQFGGRGQRYRVVREDHFYDGRYQFEIEDPSPNLVSNFTAKGCDFTCSFHDHQGPPFLPFQTWDNPPHGFRSLDCNKFVSSYLFPELYDDVHVCTASDLSHPSNTTSPGSCPPRPFTQKHPGVVIWKLSMEWRDDGSISVTVDSVSFCRPSEDDDGGYHHPPPGDAENGGHHHTPAKLIIGISAGTSGFLLTCIMLCWWLHKNRGNLSPVWTMKSKNSQNVEAFLKQYGTIIPKRYGYAEVKKITKSFTEKLGQGGYGAVFKGKLLDGRSVAVKVFKSKESAEEFINEVASIGRTHHINIVRLLGFCCEGPKRALLYEFMPNGSLEKFISFRKSKNVIHLGWEKLLEIAIGIARGLEYLHRGCNTSIVHFDIKPHNILLDEDFCPKISDFGLAKSCRPKESILSTVGVRGTIGYIAPEVFSRYFGTISSKSDVYSYGMMVLEMVGGRASIDVKANNTSDTYFPHWIYDHFDDSLALQLHGITNETEEVARKMILVGLWCIQTCPSRRPSISKAVEMLERSFEDIEVPPKPYLCSP